MKELMEEYGMMAVSLMALGILIGLIPKLRSEYMVIGEIFLNGIGG